jgi:hypothetical protein
MARMSSRNRAEFDGDPSVLLRNASAGAVTVTTAESPILINSLTKAYWDAGEATMGVATVAVNITAIKATALNETYSFSILVDTSAAFPLPNNVATILLDAAKLNAKTGFVEIPVPYTLVEKMKAGATHMKIQCTLGGTAPSITYDARLTFIDN